MADSSIPIIAVIVAGFFLITYYIPKIKDNKGKKDPFTKDLLDSGFFTIVLFVFFIIPIYTILGFQLSLMPNWSLVYQSSGSALYYFNSITISSFSQLLSGIPNVSYPANFATEFFWYVVGLIIIPIALLFTIRYTIGKFSKKPIKDSAICFFFVLLPSLIIMFVYSLLTVIKNNYGIYLINKPSLLNFSIPLILIISIALISYFIITGLMRTNKVNKHKISTAIIATLLVSSIYLYFFTSPIVLIYNNPTIANFSSSVIQNNITHVFRLQTYSNGYSLYPYDNSSSTDVSISINVSFKKGGSDFIILPEVANLSSQNVSRGILPNYILDKCKISMNITCTENTTNSNLNLSYKKFVLIKRTNSTFAGNVNLTMSYGSNNNIKKTFTINTKTNQSCIILNQYCNMSILINNANRSMANLEFRIFSSNITLKNGTIFAYGNTFISNQKYCYRSLAYNKTEVDCSYNFGFQHFGNYTSSNYWPLDGFTAMTFTSPYYMEIRGEVPQQSFVNFTLTLTENALIASQFSS